MKKKKETPNPTPDTGKGPPRCSKRWRQNEPLSRPARSPTSASGGAQGRKLSPPGTVVDVQQNVAAQRGGSENAKESPHLKQGEAEPAESQARRGRDPPLHLTLSPVPGTGNSHLHCGSSDHGDHSERSAAYRVEQGLSNAKDGTGTLTTLKQPSPRREQARSGSPVEGSGSAVRRASPQQRPTATWLEVASTPHATPVSCRGREHALFEHECALPRYLLSCA